MKRTDQILKYLLQSNRYVDIRELSRHFGVSERTARTELLAIEDYLRTINIPMKRDRKQGVFIDTRNIPMSVIQDALDCMSKEKIYYSSEERFDIILQTLLLSIGTVTLDTLGEKVGVSKSTVIKDFALAESWLNANNIWVKKKRHVGMELSYSEFDWRKAVLEYLNPHLKKIDIQSWRNSNYSILLVFDPIIDEFLNIFVRDIEPSSVNDFIRKYEEDFGVRFLDASYAILLIYLCIALSRIKQGKTVENDEEILNYNPNVRQVKWIAHNKGILTEKFSNEIKTCELNGFLLYFSGMQKYREVSEEVQGTEPDVDSIVTRFLNNVEEILNVDFSDDQMLYDNLRMHIRPAIHRITYNIVLKNPVHEDIKNLYPEIFRACWMAIQFLEKMLDNEIEENEISLLAMHVGAAVEKIRKKVVDQRFYHVLVVCAEGIGASQLLCSRLLNEFSNIIVENVMAADELMNMDFHAIDVIITTIPLFLDIDTAVIRVSPALREEDILKIEKEMKKNVIHRENRRVNEFIAEDLLNIVLQEAPDINYEKVRQSFNSYLGSGMGRTITKSGGILDYMIPSLIELNVEVENWQEAVEAGGELLYREGLIRKKYIGKMIEQLKEIGNYASIMDGVIMPHSKPSHGVIKTGFSFITLKNPVKFDEEDENNEAIRMVITLAADESMIHIKGIQDLANLLDEEFLSHVCSLTDKEDFIQYVKSKIELL